MPQAPPARRQGRNRRNKKLKTYLVDSLKVIDHRDFDADRLADGFPKCEKLHSATEISFKTRISKAVFMKALDKVVHPSVRIFEQENQFRSAAQAAPVPPPRASAPTRTRGATKKKPRTTPARVHLQPAQPKPHRYWSGATGSSQFPEPFNASRTSQAHVAPPKAPQRLLQARPKARPVAASAAATHQASMENDLAEVIVPAATRRRTSMESDDSQKARQVSNVLRSFAAVIALHPSRASAPIVTTNLQRSSDPE